MAQGDCGKEVQEGKRDETQSGKNLLKSEGRSNKRYHLDGRKEGGRCKSPFPSDGNRPTKKGVLGFLGTHFIRLGKKLNAKTKD